jgi:hypothetical protein
VVGDRAGGCVASTGAAATDEIDRLRCCAAHLRLDLLVRERWRAAFSKRPMNPWPRLWTQLAIIVSSASTDLRCS